MDLLKDPILSSVILWWLRHGAIGPLEATPLWVTEDRLNFRIHTF